MNGSDVFFSPEQYEELWGTDRLASESFLRIAKRHLDGLSDPRTPNFFAYQFMCPPSYISIYGRKIDANFAYRPPTVYGPVAACRFILRFEQDAEIRITLCGEALRLVHDALARELRVSAPQGEEAAVFPTNRSDSRHPNFIAISAVEVGGRLVIGIDNKYFAERRYASGASALQCVSGDAHLVQFQAYSAHDRVFVDFPSVAKGVDELGKNPYIPVWERQSNNLYHTFLLGAALQEGMAALSGGETARQRHVEDVAAYVEQLKPLAALYLRRLAQFPTWRPSSGPAAEAGLWDWNSWAVGLMPGAYALCARILGLQNEPSVRAAFHNLGTNWLLTTDRLEDSGFQRFPAHTHWVARSTNHGLVIYFGFLVGAIVLGLAGSEEYERVRHQLRQTIGKSVEDGSYLEGIGYFAFAFNHGLPFFWLEHRARGIAWPAYVESELTQLAGCGEWLEQANSSSGQPFANFGDNQPKHWRGTSLMKMLTSVQDTSRAPGLRFRGSMTTKSDDAYAPFARFMEGWTNSHASPDGTHLTRYGVNNLAILSYWKAGQRIATASFMGSKLHKTHNKNHDCGGFLLEAQGAPILSPTARTTQLFHNNAVCTLSDGAPQPSSTPRDYGGTLECRTLAPGIHLIQTDATYSKGFRGSFGLHRLRRFFLALADAEGLPALAVVSIVEGARGVTPG